MLTIHQRRWSGFSASRIQGTEWPVSLDVADEPADLEAVTIHPHFRAALSWANPDLLRKLHSGEASIASSLSLRRYALRFLFRATPSGLFGWTDHQRSAVGAPLVDLSNRSSLSNEVLGPDLASMEVGLNPSAYTVLHDYRFLHRSADAHGLEEWGSVERTPLLDEIVNGLPGGTKVPGSGLVQLVQDSADCDESDARAYVCALLASGLLLSVSGHTLLETPSPGTGQKRATSMKRTVQTGAVTWPALSATSGPDAQVRRHIQAYVSQQSAPPPSAVSLAINKVLGALGSSTDSLSEFKQRFDRRYGGRWVPLMVALDPEVGIGFEPFSRLLPSSKDIRPVRSRAILRIRQRLERDGAQSALSIDDIIDDLGDCSVDGSVSLLERCSASAQRYSLKRATSRGLLRPILRNLRDGDPRISEIRAYLERSQQDGPIHADVLMDYPSALGDLARHPYVTRNLIVTGADQGLPGFSLLPANALEVTVCRGQVALRCADSLRRVVPIISNAISEKSSGSTLFSFFSAVEAQGRVSLGDEWLRAETELPRLPALTYRGVEVSPQQWLLRSRDYAKADFATAKSLIMGLDHLPRYVQFGKGDKLMTVDTRCDRSLELLLHDLRKNPEIWLRAAANQQPLVASHEGGEHVVCQLPHTRAIAGLGDQGVVNGASDDWIYFKIFSSPKALLSLVPGIIRKTVDHMRRVTGATMTWHYLFYPEGGPHVRLRMRLGREHHEAARRALCELVASASRFPVATLEEHRYLPEVVRYGADMEAVHSFWRLDSERRLRDLCTQPPEEGLLEKCAHAVIEVASDLGLSAAEFSACAEVGKRVYRHEFGESRSDQGYLRAHLGAVNTRDTRMRLIDRIAQLDHSAEGSGTGPDTGLFHDLVHLSIARMHPVNFRKLEWAGYEWLSTLNRHRM